MNPDFLNEIVPHQKILNLIARAYTEDLQDREDLMQEIWLQLWKAYPAFRRQSTVTTWMYRIALNTALTYQKKSNAEKRNQREGTVPLTDESWYHTGADNQNNEEELLWKAIQLLTGADRILILFYIDGLSYREMSEISGYSESNVGVRLNRAKEKLKNIITKVR